MKTLFTFILIIAASFCYGQLKVTFENDTLEWVRLTDGDLTKDLKISIKGTNSAQASNVITISILPGSDQIYRFTAPSLVANAGTLAMQFPFTILSGTNPNSNPKFVNLQLAYTNGVNALTDTLTLKIVNEIVSEKEDSFYSKLTFLNAYNFDFYGKLNSNYVGIFNIYEPARKRIRKDGAEATRQWGINTGAIKINYGLTADTIAFSTEDNVKINPLDSIVPGAKFYRQYNQRATSVTNSSWSFYAQPLLLLNNHGFESSKTKVYAHAHTELFISKLKTKTTNETFAQDTSVIPNPVPVRFYLRDRTEKETRSETTYYNSYLGAGLTFDIRLTKTSALFMQYTTGITTNYVNAASVPNFRGRAVRNNKFNGFYLIRTSFDQRLNESTRIVFSQDIRGLFPTYNPLYATYIGLNIKVDKLLELIK